MTARMSDDEIFSKVSGTGALEVKIETIDSLFYDKDLPVTFIKADVEGLEFPLILGAKNTIRKHRPKLALTVYHDQNHFVEIRDFLAGIHDDYQFKTRGIAENGNPVLLHLY